MAIIWRPDLVIDISPIGVKKIRMDFTQWLNEIGNDLIQTAAVNTKTNLTANSVAPVSGNKVDATFNVEAGAIEGDLIKAQYVVGTVGGQMKPWVITFRVKDDYQ